MAPAALKAGYYSINLQSLVISQRLELSPSAILRKGSAVERLEGFSTKLP
jgi:hypothetical protein